MPELLLPSAGAFPARAVMPKRIPAASFLLMFMVVSSFQNSRMSQSTVAPGPPADSASRRSLVLFDSAECFDDERLSRNLGWREGEWIFSDVPLYIRSRWLWQILISNMMI